MRCETFMTASFRGGRVDADDGLWGRYTAGRFAVYDESTARSHRTRGSDTCLLISQLPLGSLTVDVRLLGPLEVRLGEGPIELGPRKQRAVLAMLALEAGRTVSADRLAEGLWGEEPPPSAPKMVQLYVSHLRRVLDGNGARIVTRGRGYELQLPDDEVDAVRFERLLEESRAREALALWRGDALADVADEPFAATEIRRLDALRLRAAEWRSTPTSRRAGTPR